VRGEENLNGLGREQIDGLPEPPDARRQGLGAPPSHQSHGPRSPPSPRCSGESPQSPLSPNVLFQDSEGPVQDSPSSSGITPHPLPSASLSRRSLVDQTL
jgi:hypothetical protein